ncbi:MAG: uroporphyrinogen-III C-methyltransferase [Chitinophagaceae bacterium]|nr:uroporphyrinogen-III C-methyltransferase [Chitinophagaceae bacterium]
MILHQVGLKQGKVILAGAGPGDPDLITIKAANALSTADVVLTDRLVSPEILKTHVPSNALIIKVGKQGHKGKSTPQKTINELMVEHASQGKTVVRLKGGDISVFSNILDELQTLVEHDILYELIPGVSAAMGAAAYTGIPLTARNYALGVRLLTFYKHDAVPADYWYDLANTDDTLVFYMSSETLDELVDRLRAHNITSDKYIAVVEQATTKNQNAYISAIHNHKQTFAGLKFQSPSLVIIGKVVALHEQFSWLKNSGKQEAYFTS